MPSIRPVFLVLLFLATLPAMAESIQPAAIPEPPELPAQIVDGENISPDITITRKKIKTVTEYSVNGNVYMIKISPDNAPAYYIIDSDGDGNLETRRSDLEQGMNIPQWLLFSW